jgi:hypothetical protein
MVSTTSSAGIVIDPKLQASLVGAQAIVPIFQNRIQVYDLNQFVDLEALTTEALMLGELRENDEVGRFKIEYSKSPGLLDVVSKITIRMKSYINMQYDYDPKKYHTESSIIKVENGLGLAPHLHYGQVALSSCFYLTDSEAPLVLMDPRGGGMAALQFPKAIRDKHFGEALVYPKKGQLIIFPSYLMHYVKPTGKNEFRLSLFTDFFIDDQ